MQEKQSCLLINKSSSSQDCGKTGEGERLDKYENVYQLIKRRRSVRRFSTDPVADSVLVRLLEAAHQAPSAHNRQPWRFVVLREQKQRERLVFAMDSAFEEEQAEEIAGRQTRRARVEQNRARIIVAPVAVLVCVTMAAADTYKDERLQAAEYAMAIQSTAVAIGYMLLAAQTEGLGVHWLCAPLFCQQTVVQTLELPRHWMPQALLLAGKPLDESQQSSRVPLQEVVRWL